MYKRQMLFQRIACYWALAAAVLVFIYSLGIMTDLYDCLYSTMMDPNDLGSTTVPGSIVYYDMQPFNRSLLAFSLLAIVVSCLLFITQTDKRRRYYIANYVSSSLVVAVGLFVTIWGHINIERFKAQWLAIDFEALERHARMFKQTYTESTFWFDVHYFVFGLCVIGCGLLVYNLVWKSNVMAQETSMIGKREDCL